MKLEALSKTMLFAASMAMTLVGAAEDPAKVAPKYYELYSWQENGAWEFCLAPSPSGVNLSAKQVFNQKIRLDGVDSLERQISTLPHGSTILWVGRLTGLSSSDTKASHRLDYPSSEIMQQIKNYAEDHNIKVEIASN